MPQMSQGKTCKQETLCTGEDAFSTRRHDKRIAVHLVRFQTKTERAHPLSQRAGEDAFSTRRHDKRIAVRQVRFQSNTERAHLLRACTAHYAGTSRTPGQQSPRCTEARHCSRIQTSKFERRKGEARSDRQHMRSSSESDATCGQPLGKKTKERHTNTSRQASLAHCASPHHHRRKVSGP